jgi:hypothetical protein
MAHHLEKLFSQERAAAHDVRRGREWVKKSQAIRGRLGMEAADRPWTSKASMTGISRSARVMDLLDICYVANTQGKSIMKASELLEVLLCDISQDVARNPWTTSGVMSTFTTTCELYSFKLDRLLVESEKFAVLGFPRSVALGFDGATTGALRDLAGDCMSVPSVTTVAYALVLALRYGALWEA